MADDFNLLDIGFSFTDPALEASADAIEASTASIDATLDVNLSTRASEATLLLLAADIASIETQTAGLATEVTLAAASASLTSIDGSIDVNLSTRATEATLATRASEATLATRASETTVASIDATLDVALSTRASEATASTIATNTGNTTTQVTTLNTNFGAQADAAASSDTGTFSFMAFVKRLLGHLTDIKANERNSAATTLASLSRTATTTSADQTNLSAQGAHIIWDVTVIGATSLTPRVQGFDATSSKWYDLLVGTAQSSVGTYVLKLHPGLPGVNNKTAADGLPVTWRFSVTHSNATATTYSVGVNYLE